MKISDTREVLAKVTRNSERGMGAQAVHGGIYVYLYERKSEKKNPKKPGRSELWLLYFNGHE